MRWSWEDDVELKLEMEMEMLWLFVGFVKRLSKFRNHPLIWNPGLGRNGWSVPGLILLSNLWLSFLALVVPITTITNNTNNSIMSQPGPISKKRKVNTPSLLFFPLPVRWWVFHLAPLVWDVSHTDVDERTMDNLWEHTYIPFLSGFCRRKADRSSSPMVCSLLNSTSSSLVNSQNKVTLAVKSESPLPEPKSLSALPTHKKSLEIRVVEFANWLPSCRNDSNSVKEL